MNGIEEGRDVLELTAENILVGDAKRLAYVFLDYVEDLEGKLQKAEMQIRQEEIWHHKEIDCLKARLVDAKEIMKVGWRLANTYRISEQQTARKLRSLTIVFNEMYGSIWE